MTAILGWSRLLPTLPPGEQSFRDAVASITRSAQLQARLIDDVLDVSRIVSGKMRLALEDVDVARLISNSIDAVRASADAKLISISTSLGPGLGTVVADSTRLQQVIWNLLTNAVKFTPKRGSIRVSARRTSSQLQISVEDSGEGIAPSFLPHVFEPFRQAENPSTRVHGGLGLGLSIVRYIAEAHGGTVSAESNGRGQGATFTVTLPIGSISAADSPGRPAGERAVGHATRGRLKGVNIMLVDDDDEGRGMVRAVLENAGAAVVAFNNATDALQKLDSGRPDILITDIAMPEMDGYALAREVRSTPRLEGLKVVALSAFPESRVDVAQSGFNGYLSKPIDPVTLVDAIVRVREAG
jgi:CheY-like chemotaxis protein